MLERKRLPHREPQTCNRTLQSYHGQNCMAGVDMASEALMHRVDSKLAQKFPLEPQLAAETMPALNCTAALGVKPAEQTV